ncbi:isocitrate lyase/phosphoenolpyruvate mutase family protein [Streptomyces sp. DSM 44938]|uniref:Isocitrate lyase/phosphoenolpyruvate mutase family protein n=2 Tax=Streptomyces litchfieldiae TaxID=3075543 RepID=A0ABU2MRD6_9ACTN|nr:isocitrate lyase/phosphoenolpyruvate mutase family protein [Streptomyces sp. DSM 44938]MDT0344192.1 isocitrate lyase/phosphoenolpyruvate mutase family protein [Streptomyces sp. DSM 44938]
MTHIADRARLFHSLHRAGDPLVLPNAWDAASARIVARAGAAAVATTSSGVAWGLGAADGDRLDRDLALELTTRVAAAVPVPVTADIESGFAEDADGVGDTVRRVVAAGAVGVNLEDTHHRGPRPLRSAADQAARLAAARRAGDELGVPVFVNARVDVFLRDTGEPGELLRETLERAKAYVAAGADGIFVPGVTDPAVVARLVAGLDAPLNVMAGPGAPPVAELAAAGAARVSVGSGLAQAAYGVADRAARELLTAGTYTELAGGPGFAELNALMDE